MSCECKHLNSPTCNTCTSQGYQKFIKAKQELIQQRLGEINERLQELYSEKEKLERSFLASEKTGEEDVHGQQATI